MIQTGERITTCANFVTKWDKHNYKVGQLRIITKVQKVLKSRAVNPLQNEVIIITKMGMYYRKGRFTTKLTRYCKLGKSFHKVQQVIHYKVGQSLLQNVIGIIKLNKFIAKWDNYYRKSQYIFVTPGQIETYVYYQSKRTLRTEFCMM